MMYNSVAIRQTIIEITGVPGVGKSTFSRQLLDAGDSGFVLFNDDLVISISDRIPLGRSLSKLCQRCMLLMYLFRNLPDYQRLVFQSARVVAGMKYGFFDKLRLLGNIFLKLGRYEFTEKKIKADVVIFDEGVSHIPFNLIDYGKFDQNFEWFFTAGEVLLSRIDVVVLQAKDSVIKSRLVGRGHKRVKVDDEKALDWFMSTNQDVIGSVSASNKFHSLSVITDETEEDVRFFLSKIRMIKECR